MSETEFYANATLGFRQWHFSPSEGAEPPVLRGFSNPFLGGFAKYGFDSPRYPWRLETPNHAECARLEFNPSLREAHGEVPGMDCSCGFYAYGRRIGSGSETTARVVGGVIAGWGTLELHERGFKCGVAKILALFEPKVHADYDLKTWEDRETLSRLCADHAIPLLKPDALRDDDEVAATPTNETSRCSKTNCVSERFRLRGPARETEENEMYGFGEYEVLRQRHEEIRHEVAVNRLARMARANRGRKPRLARDPRWELARFGELLGKRLRNIK